MCEGVYFLVDGCATHRQIRECVFCYTYVCVYADHLVQSPVGLHVSVCVLCFGRSACIHQRSYLLEFSLCLLLFYEMEVISSVISSNDTSSKMHRFPTHGTSMMFLAMGKKESQVTSSITAAAKS